MQQLHYTAAPIIPVPIITRDNSYTEQQQKQCWQCYKLIHSVKKNEIRFIIMKLIHSIAQNNVLGTTWQISKTAHMLICCSTNHGRSMFWNVASPLLNWDLRRPASMPSPRLHVTTLAIMRSTPALLVDAHNDTTGKSMCLSYDIGNSVAEMRDIILVKTRQFSPEFLVPQFGRGSRLHRRIWFNDARPLITATNTHYSAQLWVKWRKYKTNK